MRTNNQKSFIYKNEIFLTYPVKTEPYVWHLTRKRNRLAIALEGILPVNGLVFANNQNDSIFGMWHWLLDDIGYEAFAELDFWRIDVRKAGVSWYNDTNLRERNNFGRYVCTPSPIPLSAITLFKHYNSSESEILKYQKWYSEINEEICYNDAVRFIKCSYQQVYIEKMEGVANCTTWKLPLKKVDARELLIRDISLDNANKNLLCNVLPLLLEAQPEQTLEALFSKSFESFYETLFKNRKTIGSKDDWKCMFEALFVAYDGDYWRCGNWRVFRACLFSYETNAIVDDWFIPSCKIMITVPLENFQDCRFFRFFILDPFSGRYNNPDFVEEFVGGSYIVRPKLSFGGDSLNEFLSANPKTN